MRRGRRIVTAMTASRAAAKTSARMTMPGPPPAGVSSTERWRPRPCSRICLVSSDHNPRSRASPASEAPSGPGKISGNSVRIVARQAMRLDATGGVKRQLVAPLCH